MPLEDEILYFRDDRWFFLAFGREFGPFQSKSQAIEGLKRIFCDEPSGVCKNCGDD